MKCRLCVFDCNEENALRLFNNNGKTDWTKLIRKYLFLELKGEDSCSTIICRTCLAHLEEFHEFFQHIEQRQQILQTEVNATVEDVPTGVLKSNMEDVSSEELLLDVNDLMAEAETFIENPLSPSECDKDNLALGDNESISKLVSHTSTRTPKSAEQCGKQIPTAEEEKLGDELIAKHIEIKCEFCNAQMDTLKSLKTHTRKEHNADGFLTCCGKRFRSRFILLDHLEFHLNPENFKCDACNKVLKSRKLLELHKANRHTDRQELKHACTSCNKRFASSSNLNAHMLVHSMERNHKCEICNKGFKAEAFLKVHMQTHTDTKPFVCDTCGREYRHKLSFERHVADHQGLLKQPTEKCPTCGKWFTMDGLQRHMTSHNLEDVECRLCGKIVKSQNALRGHMDYVHRRKVNLACSYCDKTFKRSSVFKEHIAMHTGRKDFRCRHCSREFRSKANMYAHIKKIHVVEWAEAQLVRFKGPAQSRDSEENTTSS